VRAAPEPLGGTWTTQIRGHSHHTAPAAASSVAGNPSGSANALTARRRGGERLSAWLTPMAGAILRASSRVTERVTDQTPERSRHPSDVRQITCSAPLNAATWRKSGADRSDSGLLHSSSGAQRSPLRRHSFEGPSHRLLSRPLPGSPGSPPPQADRRQLGGPPLPTAILSRGSSLPRPRATACGVEVSDGTAYSRVDATAGHCPADA